MVEKNLEKSSQLEATVRPSQESIIPKPERSLEQAHIDRSEAAKEGTVTSERAASMPVAAPAAVAPINPAYEARRKQIESVLSENLAEAYQGLSREQQVLFKAAGENTASQINVLLSETKLQVKRIINLIKSWLSILPGINKFFLEKEAKIKADAIIQLKKGGEQ